MRSLPPVARTFLGASAMTTIGTLPVFLLSSQAVFVREDLGFDEARFGLAITAFFASAAVAALLGGRLADRLGRRRSTITAGLLAAAGGVGVGWVAQSWATLMVALAILGVANAACQVTANLTLARAVPPRRRGLGFGIKQAAIPTSIMLAGLAVPTVTALAGWRSTFLLTGLGGLGIVVAGVLVPRTAGPPARRLQQADRAPLGALLITMVAITLASAAANSLGAFLAYWAYTVGLTPSTAGVLLAAGSAVNVAVRISIGYVADLRHGRNLPTVAAQMLIGAVCLAVLSVPSPWAVVPGGLLAFALGWSWPGLLLFAVARVGRETPGFATGMLQGGAFLGGAAGPALFGLVAGSAGYQPAWLAAACCFLVASVLIIVARRAFVADLLRRPPTVPLTFGGGRAQPRHTTQLPGTSAQQSPPGPAPGAE